MLKRTAKGIPSLMPALLPHSALQVVAEGSEFYLEREVAAMIYQLSPPLLDAMVLAVIEKEEAYGYLIAQHLKSVTSQRESALYPVLKRLQSEGFLTAYDQPFQGRNRRYYQITKEGVERLAYYRQEWQDFKTEADLIMEGGERDE